jgi:beta-lactamase class D
MAWPDSSPMTSTRRHGLFLIAIVVGNSVPGGWIGRASDREATAQIAASTPNGSCFLLHEVGVGEIRREPSVSCRMPVSPQSTFKIPHALAALDAGVVTGADSQFAYDGSSQPFEAWRRDHTLQSAMRFSALWWFQRVAEKLGAQREHDYLRRLAYGNADSSSGLTTFWLGGSLVISPEEQRQFLLRLFASTLPVRQDAMRTVREILVQPKGMVVNASGEHPFGKPWPPGTVLSAKTGSGRDRSGQQVRWLVGHVSRGRRAWVFVSCVVGGDDTPPLAAVDLAAKSLHRAGVM